MALLAAVPTVVGGAGQLEWAPWGHDARSRVEAVA